MANARNLSADMLVAIVQKVIRPVMLCEIETMSGSVFMWTGYGDLNWSEQIFKGIGDFGGVDTVEETSDLTATNVAFSLSGVSPDNLEIALNEIQQSGSATLWFGLISDAGTLIADPYQIFSGITDVPEIDEDADSCMIKLTCESRLADLNRARVYYYTPQDQKIYDSNDLGFDFVAGLQNQQIIFG